MPAMTKLGDIYCFGDNVRIEQTIPLKRTETHDVDGTPTEVIVNYTEWRVYKWGPKLDDDGAPLLHEDGTPWEIFHHVGTHGGDDRDDALAAGLALAEEA